MERSEPLDPLVCSCLTDLYQVTMVYAYWKAGKCDDLAVFDLYFRTNPFKGQYTVFCGLEEVLQFLSSYRWTDESIKYLKSVMPKCDEKFFEFLSKLDCSAVKVYALKEGSLAFPNIPLLRVEGPIAICQLLETTLLTLVNYPSLVATNAARYRVAAEASSMGKHVELFEFGLRRAQGPNGGITASKYTYVGGFNGTSNVLAGQLYGIQVKGTHAHAFVTSFKSGKEFPQNKMLVHAKTGEEHNFVELVLEKRKLIDPWFPDSAKMNELAAFTTYALAFPDGFLALVDTYNTMKSGVLNFLIVALALNDLGYKPVGVRLDSGDLAYLSVETRKLYKRAAQEFNIPHFEHLKICASSDISEETLYSYMGQNEIDMYGVGTNLVTCTNHPALGCVYKLVEINGTPRLKLSNTVGKVTIPGRKEAYRLKGNDGPIVDIMIEVGSKPPKAGESIYCRHPFEETKRCFVKPTKVESLHHLVWDGKIVDGAVKNLSVTREECVEAVNELRSDHKYATNPTPYKVSLDANLYDLFHKLLLEESPIEVIN